MRFLAGFNGRAFFLDDLWVTSTTLELFTDAAGSKGYGAVFGRKWFYGSWPESWSSLNIAFLEFFPIVLALHIWGSTMANKCVCFVTDNSALVDVSLLRRGLLQSRLDCTLGKKRAGAGKREKLSVY